jgi:hypothetical protein
VTKDLSSITAAGTSRLGREQPKAIAAPAAVTNIPTSLVHIAVSLLVVSVSFVPLQQTK